MKYYITVAMALILIGISFPLKSAVLQNANKNAEMARTALKVKNTREFEYDLKTQQGNIITDGHFTVDKPVKYEEMEKSFVSVKKIREDYTMHSYTTSDSKGHTTTHYYWSWDETWSTNKSSTYINYKGHKFRLSRFDTAPLYHNIRFNSSNYYYYTSPDVRYRYKVIPNKFHAGFIANAGDKGLSPIKDYRSIKLSNKTVKNISSDYEHSATTASWAFGVIYVIVSIVLCAGTYVFIEDY